MLHTEQCEPSVLPGVVQVASTAASVTTVCLPIVSVSVYVTSPVTALSAGHANV